MEIRKATEKEMLTLWGYKNCDKISPTARFFSDNILSGNAEFWTIDNNGELIGELYFFKNLTDKDFADGQTRAYLCAFRIRSDYRGKGFGSRLLQTVLLHIKASGFNIATIGVEENAEANIRLYERHGFVTRIKDCVIDPCNMDNEMNPRPCPRFHLLSKNL
ncbi:MAG: GNAT family N-acetyltransferase [Eubacteriales bacterium]